MGGKVGYVSRSSRSCVCVTVRGRGGERRWEGRWAACEKEGIKEEKKDEGEGRSCVGESNATYHPFVIFLSL